MPSTVWRRAVIARASDLEYAPAHDARVPAVPARLADGPMPDELAPARTELSDGAWIDVQRGWLGGADTLFERLRDGVPWRGRAAARCTSGWSTCRGCSRSTTRAMPLPDPALVEHEARPRRALRAPSWASRSSPPGCACIATGATAWPGTATESAAARPRTPWSRSSCSAIRARCCCARAAAAPTLRHDLGHGDLIVMGGSCQRTWEHAVPKSARASGPRISIQFRPHNVR